MNLRSNKGKTSAGSTINPPKLNPGPVPAKYEEKTKEKIQRSRQKLEEVEEEIICDGEIEISKTINLASEVTALSFTDDLLYLAIGMESGAVNLYNVTTAQYRSQIRDTTMSESPVSEIKHRPVTHDLPMTNTLTCTYRGGYVRCWHYPSGRQIYFLQEGRQVNGLTYHQRQPKFITVGDDAQIFLYDEETLMKERVFKSGEETGGPFGHNDSIWGACFHPRTPFEFITGGWDSTIQFWDIRKPTAVRYIEGVYITGDGLDIHRAGKMFLTCSYDSENALQVWDYQMGKILMTLSPDIFNPKLFCGKWLGRDKIICGGADPNIFRIIDYKLSATIGSVRGFKGPVCALDKTSIIDENLSRPLDIAFITDTKYHLIHTPYTLL